MNQPAKPADLPASQYVPATGRPAEFAEDGTIFCHPDRPRPKKRWGKAYYHFRELLKNKEDTSHVFRIFESLPSRGFVLRARALVFSDAGKAMRATEPYLPAILDDHAALRELPKGSVAEAYLHFMTSEGLTAAGLVEEQDKSFAGRPRYDDLVEWYGNRRRDTHDLLHVLTGYGRDALGEQCVLAFTYGQNGELGNLFIAYLGALEIKRTVKGGAPVLSAVREAQNSGAGAPAVAEMPIRDLLAMPLTEARAMMGVGDPAKYRECHRVWASRGTDPYDLLGGAAA
ncbi:hypothetical protein HME9302_01042 [Alteripontixanthobacter maritimus]|uniref:Coenzyme Q (Ubiquinone) biosynthesis protein Coq4 n=1 Tax=Alteripontixanthobacter maritimus TaxID=2161824 RepID=A0A369Q9I1_9SPHN|nr:Coq4 family protein [Alteripontixanthobacter maritimus]RDC59846.1 hypothetical protein HME9302_01042 [Alteripontixanthobacter maritimus]